MNVSGDDPTTITVVAVTVEDVVAAIEANERRNAGAVLRVTPPFSGRMRARLHIAGAEQTYGDPAPLHVPPGRMVESVPPFPTPDEVADELRSDPDETYSPERQRERYETALQSWRQAIEDGIAETATIDTPSGPHDVRIAALG
ncbi:MAG: hypothetical protein PPP58_08770 [Natronomonas sp.]